jgi:hypothetical protein
MTAPASAQKIDLVAESPPAEIPEKLDGYRDAAWLLKRHAVSVPPSVAA